MRRMRVTWDLVLRATGLALIVFEAVGRGLHEPRWSLLMIYAGMIGLPTIYFAEQKHYREQRPRGDLDGGEC